MSTKIALAGNPNCGKTTMFNSLTGTVQYVGNWPGVTVEKKEGKVKSNKDLIVTDLPGIYSLSPYTNEEVVSRDYLASNEPAAVIDVVDATNIERNLYLTTQILELGKPVVVAFNMVDALKKSGDKIDTAKLAQKLGCSVIETVALHGKGVKEVVEAASDAVAKKSATPVACFSKEVEKAIADVSVILPSSVEESLRRWTAIKVLERDSVILGKIGLDDSAKAKAEEISKSLESALDDDIESIITNERYKYITSILSGVLVKSGKSMTVSDKIDRVVTNRILGIPIFLAVMWFVYWVAVSTVGSMGTDWANDVLFGEWIQGGAQTLLENAGANPILTDCIVNGILGGLGAVLGFVPQMAVLFILLSILEDVGYMVRIAFVMDRVFRKFGLSGKSFIPLLISSGCGIPGIMASRTIENENDRRMTIMTTTWIPCGAKLPVIAMMAGILAQRLGGSGSWVASSMYAIGIASVLVAAVILKKTKYFHGPAAPFIMELPQYHIPQVKTVLLHTWERLWSFIKKAGTILFLACLVMWFLSSYGWSVKESEEVAEETAVEKTVSNTVDENAVVVEPKATFGLVEDANDSVMAKVGGVIRYIFIPLGFGGEEGGWQCAASVISGFSAKEGIVSTMGVLAGASDEDTEALAGAGSVADIGLDEETETTDENAIVAENAESEEGAVAEEVEEEEEGNAKNALNAIAKWFPSALVAFCFLIFNLLNSPCLAAISTMANELHNRKWFWFAILFQNAFAYVITMIVYQLGSLFSGKTFGNGYSVVGLIFAFIFLAGILFGLFRKNPYAKADKLK